VDIAQHLPSYALAGIVYLAGLPYVDPVMMSTVATPFVVDLVGRLMAKPTGDGAEGDLQGRLADISKAKLAFVDSLFVRPDDVPAGVKWTWLGMAVGQTSRVFELVCTRTQDAAALFERGKNGLPLLIAGGTADAQVRSEKVVGTMGSLFAKTSVEMFEGLGHACFYEKPDEFMRVVRDFVYKICPKVSRVVTVAPLCIAQCTQE
jgi:pimeloyl-ACP methyl ester carboxylesterase